MSLPIKQLIEHLSTGLVILAAGAVLWQVHSSWSGRRPPPPPPIESVTGLSLSASYARNVRGTGNVVLVEFSDYECPFCAKHAIETAPLIQRDFVEPGRLQHVFLHFPLPRHSRAQKAAEAVECAAQQARVWEMHEKLFQRPQLLGITELTAHAASLGLDEPAFVACLNSAAHADKVRNDFDEGRRLGVSSTPAFFVGVRESGGDITLLKRLNGAVSFEVFRDAISDVLVDAPSS